MFEYYHLQLVYYRLPYHLLISPLSRLPAEIWEQIIDWIGVDHWHDGSMTDTLRACILVCRAWRDRARFHLYAYVCLRSSRLSKLQSITNKNRNLVVEVMHITCISHHILSALFVMKPFKDLTVLEIRDLNLSQEHPPLSITPLTYSIRTLELVETRPCTVSQLIRFINLFPRLSSLRFIMVTGHELDHKGGLIPPPHSTPRPSLMSLQLALIPGVDRLIDWYTNEGVLLAELQSLALHSVESPSGFDVRTCCNGI